MNIFSSRILTTIYFVTSGKLLHFGGPLYSYGIEKQLFIQLWYNDMRQHILRPRIMLRNRKYSLNIIWNPRSVLSPHPYPVPHALWYEWAYSEVKTIELNLKLFLCVCLPTLHCSAFIALISREKSGPWIDLCIIPSRCMCPFTSKQIAPLWIE